MESVANPERSESLVVPGANSTEFEKYSAQRDKWLATKIAHNTSLARGGYLFTIWECARMEFEATELDTARGFQIGEPVEKIAYLCTSQMRWVHYPIGDVDVIYEKDEPFIILLNPNPIRNRDFERIQELIAGGPLYNICLQEYPNKTKGFNPSHGLVTANQWKSIV
jgi:hypothetical protein